MNILKITNGKVELRKDNGSLIRIIGNGDVGIGTTAPDSKLDVEGDIRLNDNTFYLRSGTEIGRAHV